MRGLLPIGFLALALAIAKAPAVSARPEFARRESKACGYCHINPRGGGARNQTDLGRDGGHLSNNRSRDSPWEVRSIPEVL